MTANGSPDPEATKAIVGAVYPALLSEPASVRSRAQTAYTIASAIATALITAGAFGNIGDFGLAVQSAGVLAVSLWLLTAGLHISIARRVLKVPRAQPNQLLTVAQFVSAALNLATNEADALEKRLGRAAKSTYGALALTGLALLLALIWPPSPEPKPTSVLTLSRAGASAISGQCPGTGAVLTGKLTPGSLEDDFAIVLVTDDCGNGEVTMRIPPRYILAVGSTID